MTFTRQEVLDAANKAIAEKGADYVYPRASTAGNGYGSKDGPVYAEGDSPSCLVGHVIYALDPEAFAHLAAVEARNGSEAADQLTWFHYGEHGEEATYGYLPEDFWDSEAEALMTLAQSHQDHGIPWGDALARAEDEA